MVLVEALPGLMCHWLFVLLNHRYPFDVAYLDGLYSWIVADSIA